MQNLNIEALDLQELSPQETEITGGFLPIPAPWNVIVEGLINVATGLLAGWLISDLTHTPEYYGGELDPAVCEG